MPEEFDDETWNKLFTLREESTKRGSAIGVTNYRAKQDRVIRDAEPFEPSLGPLAQLPGTWANIRPGDDPDSPTDSPLAGRGWNIIALPFAETTKAIPPFRAGEVPNYRLLMNRYNEKLVFSTVDDDVPNRGINQDRTERADQLVAALDYEQTIKQTKAEDMPSSGDAGPKGLPIHHEPGLFLYMQVQVVEGFDICRLGSIPHGNSVNALGVKKPVITGPPTIPNLSAFPEGVTTNIVTAVDEADATSSTPRNRYLFPYKHFVDAPFDGLFSPSNANRLLQQGLPGNVLKTTVLDFDTEVAEAGILNVPFIKRQADASQMRSTFWLMELNEPALGGMEGNRLVLAYSQFINLDFFPRFDSKPGLIRWPHISINMLEKVAPPPSNPAV